MNNKNGQIQIMATLTTAMIIVVAVIIGILMLGIAGLFAYFTDNVLMLAGAFVLVITLVYGTKSVFEDPSNRKVSLLLLGILLGVTLIIINNVNYQSTSPYVFIDKNVGLVSAETKPCGFFCKYFALQNVALTKKTFVIGEDVNVNLKWTCPVSGSKTNLYGTLHINGASNTWMPFQLLNIQPNTLVSYNMKFNPSKEGSYFIYSCILCDGMTEEICDKDFYESSGETKIQVQKQFTSCPAKAFVTYEHDYNLEQQNYGTRGSTDHAYIYALYDVYNLVNNQCQKSQEKGSYFTLCNNGFVVEGTTEERVEGIKKCIANPNIDTTDPNAGLSMCNGDITQKCPDGSSITAVKCTNGEPEITSAKCANNQQIGDTTTTPDSSYNFVDENTQSSTTTNKTTDTTKKDIASGDDKTLIYAVLGIIAFLVIVFIIVLIIRLR
jgi:hypothetical protein